MNKIPPHKGVYILPNLITTASLLCAFTALVWVSKGLFETAAVAIFFAALLDGLDGKVARLTNSSSLFGVEYDSLADLVAFGVAPAFLLYHWQIGEFGRYGMAVCFVFVSCGAMRLARFNITTTSGASKKFFVGLPIPAAGCTIAALVLFMPHLPENFYSCLPYFCLGLGLLLGVLMVSRVRYYSFKDFGIVKAYPLRSMVVALLVLVIIFVNPKLMAFLILLGYVLAGMIHTVVLLVRSRRVVPPAEPGN
ncbi:MAG: CDP-diacylglycerol--serine O-phosphatidyltransferase [Desulfovibrionaceae bacterium]|nr:CDP-diacylglycerol--serine O-phosphatidyltransferase [Desulfovibrionaceae bacterium]